ncbi:hypothetical protein EB001_03215 [bacterium]|nr:hypothetical protein [bacterium]
MSEKYLIEYVGGCRGDFLCNFLNYNDIFLETELTSKSICLNKNLRRHINSFEESKENVDYKEFEFILSTISDKYTAVHHLFYLQNEHYELLKKYNFQIYKIIFSKEWYSNIRVESLFKNHDHHTIVDQHSFETHLKNPLLVKFFFDFYNHPKNNKNKILLNYEKLYYDIEINNMFNEIDIQKYKSLLKFVELKKEIELWGKKYYPADYSYVWNENL